MKISIFFLVLYWAIFSQFSKAKIVEFDYKLGGKMDYKSAVNYCKNQNLTLVIPMDRTENRRIFDIAVKYDIGNFWIDGNDIASKGQWVDSRNNALQYTNWHPDEPNGRSNENCIYLLFHPDGLWGDSPCSYKYSVICQKYVPIVEFGYHLTKIRMNHTSATKYCNKLSMEIVSITDSVTNKRVFHIANKYHVETFWINGKATGKEGIFLDSQNHYLQYTNWEKEIPTGNKRHGDCINGRSNSKEFWNIVLCEKLAAVICEKIVKVVEFNYHVNATKMNFVMANNYCRSIYRELVIIKNNTSNKAIFNLATKYKLGWYWINGNDIKTEGYWVDSFNNPLTYTNWKPGTPNGKKNENCIVGLFYPDGFWNDIPCKIQSSIICERNVQVVEYGYHLNKDKMSYLASVNYCIKLGMDLVTPTDAEMNTRVYEIAKKYKVGRYWIDGNDNEKEGEWVDSKFEPLKYKNWKNKVPIGGRQRNCIAALIFPNAWWTDISCHFLHSTICEERKIKNITTPTTIKPNTSNSTSTAWLVSTSSSSNITTSSRNENSTTSSSNITTSPRSDNSTTSFSNVTTSPRSDNSTTSASNITSSPRSDNSTTSFSNVTTSPRSDNSTTSSSNITSSPRSDNSTSSSSDYSTPTQKGTSTTTANKSMSTTGKSMSTTEKSTPSMSTMESSTTITPQPDSFHKLVVIDNLVLFTFKKV